MALAILGAIILFLYLFLRLCATASAWMSGAAIAPIGNWRCGIMGDTRAGVSPTRRRSASATTARTSGSAWRRRSPASRWRRGRGWWRGSTAACRSGWSWRRSRGPRRRSHPRGRAWSASATRSSTAATSSRPTTPRWPVSSSRPAVRWAIDNLHRLAPPGGMLISINPERLWSRSIATSGRAPRRCTTPSSEALTIHDGLQQGVAARLAEGVSIVAVGADVGRGRRAARSARSAASRSSTPAFSAPHAGPPTTAIAGSSSAPARSTAATASRAFQHDPGQRAGARSRRFGISV